MRTKTDAASAILSNPSHQTRLSVRIADSAGTLQAFDSSFVEPTIAAIVKGGRSGERGEIGDGKIFVLPMDECVRIRTGERGREAI